MNLTLDERAVLAKNSEEDFERLILEYRPFILGCVYNHGFGHDEDDIGTAIGAFYDAVQAYRSDKGSFIAFAATIIQRRLIDQKRKALKHIKNTVTGEDADIQIEDFMYRQQHDIVQRQYESRLEIIDFIKELGEWGIKIEYLRAATPRHKITRHLCSQAIQMMLNEPALRNFIKTKRRLPLKDLAHKLGVKTKLLENHRRYLIAAFIIHNGEYIYLKEYVPTSIFGKEAAP